MTNEEIEKRFKFDLEMNRFFGSSKEVYFDVRDNVDIQLKLITLLYKYGYKINTFVNDRLTIQEQKEMIRGGDVTQIFLNGNCNTYTILQNADSEEHEKYSGMSTIKPPDYIKEYVL